MQPPPGLFASTLMLVNTIRRDPGRLINGGQSAAGRCSPADRIAVAEFLELVPRSQIPVRSTGGIRFSEEHPAVHAVFILFDSRDMRNLQELLLLSKRHRQR
jgi:hypothetical protein